MFRGGRGGGSTCFFGMGGGFRGGRGRTLLSGEVLSLIGSLGGRGRGGGGEGAGSWRGGLLAVLLIPECELGGRG